MATMEVRRKDGEIHTLSMLIDRVNQEREGSSRGAVWLRGMSDIKYRLLPSIGRTYKFAGKSLTIDARMEEVFLHQFQRHAFEFYGRQLSKWEALIVARHHGLPVRLLDWTANPMVAMYFACEFEDEQDASDAAIWLLIPNTNNQEFSRHIDVFEEADPFKVEGVRMIYPMVAASRVNTQSGLFTIQNETSMPLNEIDVSKYKAKDVDVSKLIELTVPGEFRFGLLKELNDLQVTRRTLFPDLDGLSKGLISSEVMRKPRDPKPGNL